MDKTSRRTTVLSLEVMRLTLNEHHRKLRGVGHISDWLVSADVSGFCHTNVLGPEGGFTFVSSMNSCCLPRLSAASHDYLLPLITPSLRLRYLRYLVLDYFYGVVTV